MGIGRTAFWLLVSVALTVGLTAVLWFALGVPVFFGFLFLPLLFGLGRLFGGRRAHFGAGGSRTCPRCGFGSADPEVRYCPRDGSPLV